jgi:hypothetical protein
LTERNWRTLLGDKWLPLIEELATGHMTEQQITDEYGLTAEN